MTTSEDEVFRLLKRPTYSQLNELWVKQGAGAGEENLKDFLARHGWTEAEVNVEVSRELEAWRLR
jgi:hypothetical protein